MTYLIVTIAAIALLAGCLRIIANQNKREKAWWNNPNDNDPFFNE
ncbi:hypothetical protein Pan5_36 [Pseudanabaena phage Pan5]|nr:hypothetical protein Pan5_36 [Pseudanabaena phage Pan5]